MNNRDIVKKEEVDYNYIDVCNMLQVNESTVKEWCNFFQDLIQVRTHRMVRKFSQNDIEKFAFIKYLIIDKKMSIVEAHNYCLNNGFKDSSCNVVILNNKEFMQEFAKIIITEMNSQFVQLKQSLDDNTEVIKTLNRSNNVLKDDLINISEGTNNVLRMDIQNYINTSNNQIKNLAMDHDDNYKELKNDMKETKDICNTVVNEIKMLSRVERNKQTSIFHKIFHKK